MANESFSENKQKSFGDLLTEENKPQNTEPPSEPAKPFSFGDLIKEADDKKQIPDDSFEIKDTPQEATPPPQVQPPPQQQQTSQPTQTPQPQVIEKPVEVIKEVIKEVPVVNQDEVDRQIKNKLMQEQTDRRNLANRVRAEKVTVSLDKILTFAKNNSEFNNLDIRDLLHVSQSTATTYLSQLVNNGRLKKTGKSKYTKYSLI